MEPIRTESIALSNLTARPDNANRMSDALFEKLLQHIKRTNRYPPIIVRSLSETESYEILDGHHRVKVLEQLEHTHANCVIWENVDDDEALILLTTLNRLEGHDDVHKRSDLIAKLVERIGHEKTIEFLPEDKAKLDQLLKLRLPIPEPAEAPNLSDMPEAVVFFLNGHQHRCLNKRLREHEGTTRSDRLITMLQLDESTSRPDESG